MLWVFWPWHGKVWPAAGGSRLQIYMESRDQFVEWPQAVTAMHWIITTDWDPAHHEHENWLQFTDIHSIYWMERETDEISVTACVLLGEILCHIWCVGLGQCGRRNWSLDPGVLLAGQTGVRCDGIPLHTREENQFSDRHLLNLWLSYIFRDRLYILLYRLLDKKNQGGTILFTKWK